MSFSQTPLSQNGKLKLVGKQLSNQCGSPLQLRGLSTHGVQFHKECYNQESVNAIATTWKADVLRLAIYTENVGGTAGYITGDKALWDAWIDQMVTYTEQAGIYVIIDWHILSDGDPQKYKSQAKTFFASMSNKYKNKNHVIYEICNEPNGGTSWSNIKSYAEEVIPVIRANDPNGIIIVGTPNWSSSLWDAANNKLTGANAFNVMYAFHFYAGSHYDYGSFRSVLGEIPVFVSEWGTTDASGNGGFNSGSANTWISIMNGDNAGGVKVSNCNWAFVDKDETASLLKSGSCATSSWNNRTTESGNYVFNYLTSADNFTACNADADDDKDGVNNGSDACPGTPLNTTVDSKGCTVIVGDDDKDGVINTKDLCANTPAGTTVNVYGCPITENYVSNVCNGLNNYQGWARNDFSVDSLTNVDFWNRPEINNPVFSAKVQGGELVTTVKNSTLGYVPMGFSFGETYRYNGTGYDTSLIPLNVSGYPVVKFKTSFQGNNYTGTQVMLRIQLEDVNGKVVNSGPNAIISKNINLSATMVDVTADFTNGTMESWNADTCAKYGKVKPSGAACYFSNGFDFSKVNKVIMFVNPGAKGTSDPWSSLNPFSGTWKMDDFSIGYNSATALSCTPTRDDDGDGVIQEKDKCPNTPKGMSVDAKGCAAFQQDDDQDGVANTDDKCPGTPAKTAVNQFGCDVTKADDDLDGVLNTVDQCAGTKFGATVDSKGCEILTATEITFTSSTLNVFPIPTSNEITIDQATFDYSRATVLDIHGAIVKETILEESTQTISLEGLAKGIYMIRLTGSNKSELVKILVH